MAKNKRPAKVLMSGNEAMGEAAIIAGCKLYAGYPITPQNELTAYMAERMKQEQRVFIQAESELAAINMVFGASVSGARAMTSSSGPGISLKQEGISYLAGCQLPAVIINVMRGGPGLGNIDSSQSDYFQATRGGGHGDYYTPVLAPWSVEEAMKLVLLAFDLADYYRNPVLILADAIIGQIMEPVDLSFERAFKKKLPKKSWALTGAKKRPANVIRSLFLGDRALERHNDKLGKKWEKIRKNEQRFSTYKAKDAEYLIISYGSQARIALEAVDILRKQKIRAGLFRPISLWPYPKKGLKEAAKEVNPVRDTKDAICRSKISNGVKKVLVVEQSLGQMVEDVRASLPFKEVSFLGKAGGGIPQAKEIVRFFKKNL